jgi:hypothetical protein
MIPKTFKTIFLAILTIIYIFIIILCTPFTFSGLFKEILPTLLFFSAVFGVLGLIGVWLLYIIDTFKNKFLKTITLILIIFGIISALYVASLWVSMSSGLDALMGFFLTWGLLIFIVIVIIYTKIKLFPEKK